ncbi:SIS domain-containing protein [bacterium]|nr:SIS domain-containing protein [bacterium]
MSNFIETYITQSTESQSKLKRLAPEITKIVHNLAKVIRQGGTIYSCGNGGSACDAMHLTEELVARYLRERPGIRAQHFLDPSTMSCWSNDYDYDTVFSRQAETFLTDKDALIVFSTSGNSPNIVKVLNVAKARSTLSIALLGKTGGHCLDLAEHVLLVESMVTSQIQEAHMLLVHMICDLLEQELFPNAK